MNYTVEITDSFSRELTQAPRKISKKVAESYSTLRNQPKGPHAKIKKLQKWKDFFRYRIGDYRFAYHVCDREKTVKLIALAKRDNFYKKIGHDEAGQEALMQHGITEELLAALSEIFADPDSIQSEEDLQLALSQKLEPCQRELRMTFLPPAIPPRRPSEADIAELSQKDPPITLPSEGKDPCVSRARLDLLWNREGQQIPIELKFVDDYKSDVYSYYFLKDLHRLERLESLRDIPAITDFRYSIFVTNQSVYWEGRAPEPEPFWLTDGSILEAGSWFQYPQPSPRTRWVDYPPFYLSGEYSIKWVKLQNGFRSLISTVQSQTLI